MIGVVNDQAFMSSDELRFICRARFTFCACSLILLACLDSTISGSLWFSLTESLLDGSFLRDNGVFDPANVGKALSGVL